MPQNDDFRFHIAFLYAVIACLVGWIARGCYTTDALIDRVDDIAFSVNREILRHQIVGQGDELSIYVFDEITGEVHVASAKTDWNFKALCDGPLMGFSRYLLKDDDANENDNN